MSLNSKAQEYDIKNSPEQRLTESMERIHKSDKSTTSILYWGVTIALLLILIAVSGYFVYTESPEYFLVYMSTVVAFVFCLSMVIFIGIMSTNDNNYLDKSDVSQYY